MPPILPNKTYTIPSTKHKYAYIHHPASNSTKPTLLFIHGFPSTSYEWRFQIPYFRARGYGILVPDLLGYGGTSRPTDINSYLGSSMSAEIIAILDHEGLNPKTEDGSGSRGVIAIAHDWGTYLLSQLASRYQDRFEKFVFMSVPFTIPGRKTDIEMVNRRTKEKVGYEMMGYFLLLSSPRAGRVLGQNVGPFFLYLYHMEMLLRRAFCNERTQRWMKC
jgi:soluble epoxide hydrolase / lipid-phosphate phosphatase